MHPNAFLEQSKRPGPLLIIAFFMALPSLAQLPYNAVAPNGYTKKAMVAEQVGLAQVSIAYQRPKLNGREGKIWGQVIHKGFVDLGFGSRNPAPWRAGANENTVIEFDQDVKIEGQPLAKGKYGFFIAYDSLESTVIFSKRHDAWGAFFYNEKEDALRVKIRPQPIEKTVETLKFEFSHQTPNSAIIALSWDQLSIPFKVEVDYLQQQMDAFTAEAQNPGGFTAQGLCIAANWALQNNYGLEKALQWATLASGPVFPGDPAFFAAHATKALILYKLGRSEEAAAVIKTAIPLGSIVQLQQFGRQLLTEKKPKIALEVFQYNYNKAPDQLITLTGMARGLSALGDFTRALDFATKALPLAPNDQTKAAIQGMMDELKNHKALH